MGGQGGKKKQIKSPAKQVVAVRPSAKVTAPVKVRAAPAGTKRPRSAEDVIPVTSTAESDYSDNEERTTEAPMALDDKTTKQLTRALRGLKPTPEDAGVIYLGHIPHGFYEDQMRGFFSQFGGVSRLRLARNTKASVATTPLYAFTLTLPCSALAASAPLRRSTDSSTCT